MQFLIKGNVETQINLCFTCLDNKLYFSTQKHKRALIVINKESIVE